VSEPASNNPGPDPVPPTVEALQREVEHLRWQLARKTTEADMYRATVYDWLRDKMTEPPMTEEEIRRLLLQPRGETSLADLLAELEREAEG